METGDGERWDPVEGVVGFPGTVEQQVRGAGSVSLPALRAGDSWGLGNLSPLLLLPRLYL